MFNAIKNIIQVYSLMASLKKSRFSESSLMANMDQLPCVHITTAYCGLMTSAWQTIFLTPTRIAQMPQIETIGTVLYTRVGRCVVRIDATHNTSQRLLLPTLRATYVAHIVCLMFFRLNLSVRKCWLVKILLLALTKLAEKSLRMHSLMELSFILNGMMMRNPLPSTLYPTRICLDTSLGVKHIAFHLLMINYQYLLSMNQDDM